MVDIIKCSHCSVTVIPRKDGTCPSCGTVAEDADAARVVASVPVQAERKTTPHSGSADGDLQATLYPQPWITLTGDGSLLDYRIESGEVVRIRSAPRMPVTATLLRLTAVLAVAVSFGLFLSAPAVVHFTFPLSGAALAFFLFLWSAQMVTPPVTDVLQADSRKPVLYLRPFETESVVDSEGMGVGEPGRNLEQTICSYFQNVGPLLAVGKTGELLPWLGASRLYVADDHWQTVVGDLIGRCQLVIIRAGESPGVRWEIREAVRRLPPTRLVILLIYGLGGETRQERYERFVARAQPHFPKPLPRDIGNAFLMYFDEDWEPYLLREHDVENTQSTETFAFQSHPFGKTLHILASSSVLHPSWGRVVIPIIVGFGLLAAYFLLFW